jgi:hypothetical protein
MRNSSVNVKKLWAALLNAIGGNEVDAISSFRIFLKKNMAGGHHKYIDKASLLQLQFELRKLINLDEKYATRFTQHIESESKSTNIISSFWSSLEMNRK